MPYDEQDNVLNWIISFNPPVNESDHIVDDGTGNGTKIVTTAGGVLLAKVSFQMTADEFDMSSFSLKEDTNSPESGIKINLNITNAFTNQSTFRFKDATASKNADLSDIIVSSGTVDEENPDNSTYKEYELTPEFEKDTLSYQMELLEYIDEIDIKPVLSDTKSSIKIRVPKRDIDNKLVYDTDGITILYEEKEIQNNIPSSVKLNKLGEPDTKITVIITAEDNKTVKNYDLVVKRPYGTIKGSIFLKPMESTKIYKAKIRLYKSDDVKTKIDWTTVTSGKRDSIHDTLLTFTSIDNETNDDGTYEIYVIPGTYDILLDRDGYLDHVIASKTINSGDTLDIGLKELYAGDFNKDGVIQLLDLSMLYSAYQTDTTSSNFDKKIDVNDDGRIQLLDLSALKANYEVSRIVE